MVMWFNYVKITPNKAEAEPLCICTQCFITKRILLSEQMANISEYLHVDTIRPILSFLLCTKYFSYTNKAEAEPLCINTSLFRY